MQSNITLISNFFILLFLNATIEVALAGPDVKAKYLQGVDGCYIDGNDEYGYSQNLRKRIKKDQTDIPAHFSWVKGSQKATDDGLKEVFIFKDESPEPYQLLILNIERFLNFYPNVVPSKEPLIPPSDVAYEGYYHVFKPKKKTLIDLAMPDGGIVTAAIKSFRINNTSCSHRRDEFYFSKKLPVKPQEIFLGYSVSSPAKFRLLKIKKFNSYDVYKVTRENLNAPDYLIAIDPRDSTTVSGSSVDFRIVHIFKSSSRGWETMYSQDNSLCEGGC